MTVTNYIWDYANDNLLMEEDDNFDTVATYTNEPGQFGELISQCRDRHSYFHQYDGLGSTTTVTNDNQNAVETAAYSAFGEAVATTSSITNPFGYRGATGYYTDGGTGGLSVRRRILSVLLGRWLSQDPARVHFADDGSVQLYAYASSDPINRIDPTGLAHKPIGTEGCSAKELQDIDNAVKQACEYIGDVRGERCLPAPLMNCLRSICGGNILTKCVKECDKSKGHHAACATAQVTKDESVFSDPEIGKPCESSVPRDTTPVITLCYTIKGQSGGISNPGKCIGGPADMSQVIFHELMHFCGSKHVLDDRGRPKPEGDLVLACMRRCFMVGPGNIDDCRCEEC